MRLNKPRSLEESGYDRIPHASASRPLAWIACSLLVLCAISILTMPLTQYLWGWDRFMHGGQDFELGTLMVLTLLCLALVLPKLCKQCVQSLFVRSCPARTGLMHGSRRAILSTGESLISRTLSFPV